MVIHGYPHFQTKKTETVVSHIFPDHSDRIIKGHWAMACVDRWLNYGVSLEALLRALVLRQSQGIRGGGPAHHVNHLLTSMKSSAKWR